MDGDRYFPEGRAAQALANGGGDDGKSVSAVRAEEGRQESDCTSTGTAEAPTDVNAGSSRVPGGPGPPPVTDDGSPTTRGPAPGAIPRNRIASALQCIILAEKFRIQGDYHEATPGAGRGATR